MGTKPTTEYHVEAGSTQRRRERRGKRREAKTSWTEGTWIIPSEHYPRNERFDSRWPLLGFLCAYLCVLCVSALNSRLTTTPPAVRNRSAPVRASRGWRGARNCGRRLPGRATSMRARD